MSKCTRPVSDWNSVQIILCSASDEQPSIISILPDQYRRGVGTLEHWGRWLECGREVVRFGLRNCWGFHLASFGTSARQRRVPSMPRIRKKFCKTLGPMPLTDISNAVMAEELFELKTRSQDSNPCDSMKHPSDASRCAKRVVIKRPRSYPAPMSRAAISSAPQDLRLSGSTIPSRRSPAILK